MEKGHWSGKEEGTQHPVGSSSISRRGPAPQPHLGAARLPGACAVPFACTGAAAPLDRHCGSRAHASRGQPQSGSLPGPGIVAPSNCRQRQVMGCSLALTFRCLLLRSAHSQPPPQPPVQPLLTKISWATLSTGS